MVFQEPDDFTQQLMQELHWSPPSSYECKNKYAN